MLEFTFKQDTEFSDPYYEIVYDGIRIGTLRHTDYLWRVHALSYCPLLAPTHFTQIASKINELDASLRAQRWWFK